MRIRLRTTLDCPADRAWEALHDPRVAEAVYAPVFQMQPLGVLPAHLHDGDRIDVKLLLFGRIPVGLQRIDIRDIHFRTARIMRDQGRPLTGPLSLLRSWNHEITVLPDGEAPGQCYWLDELTVTGAFAALASPVLWVMWQWRGVRLRQLARADFIIS